MPPLRSGIVLAGGGATRFGSDKLAATVDGVPLVRRAVDALSAVADGVIVVLAPGAVRDDLPAGVTLTHDLQRGEGSLAGLHTGLMAATRSDLVVVAGGDMPELQPSVLRLLLDTVDEASVDAVALGDGEGSRPLPIALRTWPAADAVHTLLHAGRRRLRDVLGTLRTAVIDEATWTALDPDRLTLRDIDEPGDLPGYAPGP
ncbi:MAG: molybdenum cofactor guanylyltransferase [Acidobacteria bacterium]|nr:molybdenum cofactor guanylyltransferase [Acidobacteriota bacterium]